MISITLPPEIEQRLKGEATRRGLKAEEYAGRLIVQHLPPAGGATSLTDLFAEWEAEDGTNDAVEIERRNREVASFKQAMDRNRQEMEGLGARRLMP